jgi:hypothetical protein
VIFLISGKLLLDSFMMAIILSNVTLRFVSLLFRSNLVISKHDIRHTPRIIDGMKFSIIMGNGFLAALKLNMNPG